MSDLKLKHSLVITRLGEDNYEMQYGGKDLGNFVCLQDCYTFLESHLIAESKRGN